MKTKHTTGPWRAGTYKNTNACYVEAGERVIYEETTTSIPSEISANARLIAASPELLFACKQTLEHWRKMLDMPDNYRITIGTLAGMIGNLVDVINKAEGKE